MQKSNSIWLGVAVAAAIVVSTCGTASATGDTLAIYEEDIGGSPVLFPYWDGTLVSYTGPNDNWTITLPVAVSISGFATAEFGAGQDGYNNIWTVGGQSSTTVHATSDAALQTGFTVIPNDTFATVGSDANGSVQGLYSEGPLPTVPDNGSTALMALGSIITLLGVARLRTAKS